MKSLVHSAEIVGWKLLRGTLLTAFRPPALQLLLHCVLARNQRHEPPGRFLRILGSRISGPYPVNKIEEFKTLIIFDLLRGEESAPKDVIANNFLYRLMCSDPRLDEVTRTCVSTYDASHGIGSLIDSSNQ